VAEVPSGYSFLLAYVNPDGTHFTSIDVGLDPEADSWNLDDPTFSPDGTRLAFSFNCLLSCDTAAIVTVKTDGTDWHYVASDPDIALDYLAPAWRPGPKLVNSVLPSIHGTPMDGSVLTASNGTWFGTTPIDTYQWIRCSSTVTGCAAITGQTASTHTLTSADVGHRLEVTVTATNGSGSLAKTSGATVTIAQRPPSAYMLPVVTGSALRGHTLSTTAGLWHGTALSAPLYRWYRCNTAGVACVYITGATHSTYTVTAADHPWRLRSRIFRSNLTGTVAAFSNPTAIVP
jgi:hypothetical protein